MAHVKIVLHDLRSPLARIRGIAEMTIVKDKSINIFQRFYRCDQSRSKGGVGLGLSLVKAYTESMKGTVLVRSDLGRGSIFSLRFTP